MRRSRRLVRVRAGVGWEAAAARDGVFRDGAGVVRRGGLRGGRCPARLRPWRRGAAGTTRGAVPTSGGITQARRRLGPEPLELLFDRVAAPVAGVLTRGAFLRHWRLMAIDGSGLDVPDTPPTLGRSATPQARGSTRRSRRCGW